ncbi:DNA-binding transcriptional regulator, AcrR family [Amycolatopsis arida]|uniref:DNA-binding transcriptional regulator, AcrR family n=1 Tax=Amycolatopsis arida TaxID=587909 RepID=A0A1I5XZ72_9PSEU|nr:TetR/AcrR family transcriptional regulator [Amycolatopsis arida]TDX97183.1 AcrR family transcriptional regulator [Amycolatopsis arida]SFQ37194.1 DNA-binding transcriptional regulator, AcrR family [Amycolatopsis arida]
MDKKRERGHATRDHVVTVATRLFAEHGYDGTSVEAVLRESGLSRGALYHHFPGKDALFTAVLEALHRRVDERMAAATRGSSDPVAAVRAGCAAWIRLTGDPAVQRILLLDAPAVLGWQRWRELDEQHVLGRIRRALTDAAGAGLLAADHVDVFAHALLATMNEVGLMLARARDHAAAVEPAEAAVDELLRRLLAP